MTSPCAFGVLGPLQIAGEAPALPRQAQVLLGVLLLRANEIVSPLRLCDEIWGEEPPASAANAVQVYVSRLRKTVEAAGVAAAITRHPAGYVLEVDSRGVDWLLYNATLDAAARLHPAEPERSAALVRDALALWRGPVLAGLTFESVTATEISQLEESRIAAVERRIDYDLALGRHVEVVAELQGLIVEHPFRESLRCKLVLALYRAGRQADALDECRRAARALRDELGLEPGPALRGLEQAVLVQDPQLAPPPAAPPKAAPDGAEGRRRPVAAVWLSLDDVALADRDPELAETTIARWTDELTGCLERHGASILPGMPGEIAAIFGLTRAREDDALRACRAALDARATHDATVGAQAGEALALRGGVDVGEVVEGAGREPGVTGTVVGRARRLAGLAGHGEILLGDSALGLVREGVDLAGERTLAAVRRTAEAIPRRLTRPLVGRHGELDAVRRHVAECIDWALPGLTVMVGPAGIGKSRLAAEALSQVGEHTRILRARCLPDEQGVAFAPLRDVVDDLLAEQGRAGLETIAADDDAAVTVARFAALAGEAEIASTREETFLAVRRVLEGLAAVQPLMLLVEDLHWAEPSFLDLLVHVAGAAHGPIAIVATARSELLAARPELAAEHPRCSAIAIGPLAGRDCHELFAGIPGGTSLPRQTRSRIVEASGGNPLFIEQLVAMTRGATSATGELAVPPSLRALLLARADGLAPAERSVLEMASVLGEPFQATDVAALAAGGPDRTHEVEAGLRALVAQDVLRAAAGRGPSAYTIAHPLLRTTVYDSISKRLRARLHERLAELPAEGGGARPDDVVGHHLERAFRYRLESSPNGEGLAELGGRARSRLTAAGRRSLVYGDVATAVNLLSRALSATLDPHDTPPSLALELGDALREAGRLAEAEEMLQRSVAAARASQDETLVWRARASLVRVLLQLQGDEPDVIRSLADETLERLTDLGDDAGLSIAWWAQAWIAWLGCRAAETEDALAHAIDCARRAGDMKAEAHSANLYLGAGLFGPLPVPQAVERCLDLRERHHSSRRLVASANRALSVLRAMQGAFDEARELAGLDRRVLDDLGMRYLAAAASEAHGLVELLAGDPAAAERVLREGYDALVAMGDHNALPTVGAMLGEALFQRQRYDEALAVTTASAREAGEGDLQAQVQWRLPHAKALAARGRREEAVRAADEACALAAGTDFLNLRADSHAALGEAWRLLGERAAAASALAHASALYEQKGNVVAASRTDVMLRALAQRRA